MWLIVIHLCPIVKGLNIRTFWSKANCVFRVKEAWIQLFVCCNDLERSNESISSICKKVGGEKSVFAFAESRSPRAASRGERCEIRFSSVELFGRFLLKLSKKLYWQNNRPGFQYHRLLFSSFGFKSDWRVGKDGFLDFYKKKQIAFSASVYCSVLS